MATASKLRTDVALFRWTEDTPAREIHAAFRRKNAWVVDARVGSSTWYRTVIANLTSSPIRAAAGDVEAARTVLHRGLPRKAFDRLKLIAGAPAEELARVVQIPPRTLARRKTFKPDESERILRVTSAFQEALAVLGEVEAARRWFASPNTALGGKTPLEFCDTQVGAAEVTHLLGRIEHGVFT